MHYTYNCIFHSICCRHYENNKDEETDDEEQESNHEEDDSDAETGSKDDGTVVPMDTTTTTQQLDHAMAQDGDKFKTTKKDAVMEDVEFDCDWMIDFFKKETPCK